MSDACSIQSLRRRGRGCRARGSRARPRLVGRRGELDRRRPCRAPVSTCALTTTGPPSSSAAARASGETWPTAPPRPDAVARKSLLALVLVEVHGRGRVSAAELVSPSMEMIASRGSTKRYAGGAQRSTGVRSPSTRARCSVCSARTAPASPRRFASSARSRPATRPATVAGHDVLAHACRTSPRDRLRPAGVGRGHLRRPAART
jgi:hypothetical protein